MKTILGLHQWKTRVSDVFSMAQCCGMTHAAMLEYLNEKVHSELNRKWANGRRVYSAYVSGFVSGLIQLQFDMLFRYHLHFCFVGSDGTVYSTHKGITPNTEEFYSSGRGCELSHLPSAHFWIKAGKPFNVPSVMGAGDAK